MNTPFSRTKNIVFSALFAAWIFVPSVLFAQTAPVSGSLVVRTQPISNIGTSWATLNGYASNPGTKVTLWFEWGETSSFGKVTQSKVRWGEQTASMPVEGLTSGTRYYYHAVAISAGETVYGDTLSFVVGANVTQKGKENITAVTERPENIFDTAATLRGFATGEDGTIERWFEYGETASFGKKTPVSTITNGYGKFEYPVTGLRANTVYFYRAVARGTNDQTVYGVTVGFRTGNAPGAMGVYLGEGTTVPSTVSSGSKTVYKQTATVASGTKKPISTTNKKTDAVDCATTTTTTASIDDTESGLGASVSSNGVSGSILLILAFIVAVLGAIAAAMHVMALREEARRKETNERMIIA